MASSERTVRQTWTAGFASNRALSIYTRESGVSDEQSGTLRDLALIELVVYALVCGRSLRNRARSPYRQG